MLLPTALEVPGFQGPLDLLLNLIERRRLAITDVSLASVADQYLESVRALPAPDPDVLSEFLVIAARLLLLKSRALLPQPEEPDDEESVDDLAERLEAYRRFKEVALELAERFESGEQAFPHPPRPEMQHFQAPLAPIDAAVLARLWRTIAARQAIAPQREAPLDPRVSVADRLTYLRGRLTEGRAVRWSEIAGDTLDELIATFLAVLELVRRSELLVRQEQSFGPIVLEPARRASVACGGQAGGGETEQLE